MRHLVESVVKPDAFVAAVRPDSVSISFSRPLTTDWRAGKRGRVGTGDHPGRLVRRVHLVVDPCREEPDPACSEAEERGRRGAAASSEDVAISHRGNYSCAIDDPSRPVETCNTWDGATVGRQYRAEWSSSSGLGSHSYDPAAPRRIRPATTIVECPTFNLPQSLTTSRVLDSSTHRTEEDVNHDVGLLGRQREGKRRQRGWLPHV